MHSLSLCQYNNMRIKQFVDDELRMFSTYDNVRSIPSVIDGLKPSQRKSIFGMLKRGENADEIRVETAANHVTAVSDYHHGATSLVGTIAKMAQTFAGSNNINLFMPNGQFGSRLDPTPGAGRYIYTELSKSFRAIFKKEDDVILQHLYSDEMQIEPVHYFPILPMILVNGASGTGTGYACEILSYNPADIKANILAILANKDPKEILPWFRGFKGKITRNEKQTVIEGCYEVVNTTTIRITELPIGTYQDDYKEHLNNLKDEDVIKSYADSSTEDGFDFLITIPRTTGNMEHEQIVKTFKLISKDTENFTCWGHDGKMKVFENPQQIINYFVEYRLRRYEDRRLKQIENLSHDLAWATERLRFIKFYLKSPNDFSKKNKADLFELLNKYKFNEIDKLLQIRIYSMTLEEIAKLEKEIVNVSDQSDALKSTSNLEMYIKELKELKDLK
jgi:DNA topoisomerase-2